MICGRCKWVGGTGLKGFIEARRQTLRDRQVCIMLGVRRLFRAFSVRGKQVILPLRGIANIIALDLQAKITKPQQMLGFRYCKMQKCNFNAFFAICF